MWEMKEIRELKEGRYVDVDEEPCKIVKITTSKPDAVSIFTGAKKSIVGPVSTKVQVPMIDKRKGQVLSISGNEAMIMDLETFEQISVEINPDHEQPVEEGGELLYIVAMGRYKIM